MGRPVVFGRQLRVYVSRKHMTQIDRETALTGATRSEVMRQALDQYFAKRHEQGAKR